MNLILRHTLLAAFFSLFLLNSSAFAQDKPAEVGTPGKAEKTEKIDKVEKTDKVEKNEKTVDGLAPITLNDLAIDFPEVEGWERGEIQKYPTEDLGLSVNYESREGGRVTIYVYTGGKKNIPDNISDKIIKDELNNVKNEIRKVADMGYYENLRELKNESVTLGGKVKALYTLFNFSAGDAKLTSEIYIFGKQNKFIKIRATRPRENGEAGDKIVANLLAEIASMFSN